MIAAYRRFNEWLALKIVSIVGTMECSYAFAALALVSLPEAIRGGVATLVAWVAQTFIQLVLLSIIMVGQDLQQRRLDELHDKHDLLHEKHAAALELHEQHAADLAAIHAKIEGVQ